ncbi:MAG: sulfoxide reductase heme-binding subunit YedZ [Dehalococcoidales bacterium]|nr:sulfoxide reductase heme-binding subunit YedZ [Dehalococcoidales bacterium]
MLRRLHRLRVSLLPLAVHVGSLVPLAILLWDFATDRLTANPIQEVQLRTGRYALILLVLSLACSPVSRMLRLPRVQSLRRPLGLYAFMYAGLHLLNFVAIDYGFDPGLIGEGIFEKRYVLLGFASFLALLPLAVTSTRGWMKRLGRNWQRLHWLVYLASVLAIAHFALQVKADLSRPVLFAVAVTVLMIARLPVVRRTANRFGGSLRRLLP